MFFWDTVYIIIRRENSNMRQNKIEDKKVVTVYSLT